MSEERIPNLALEEQKMISEKNIEFAFKSIKSEWSYDDEFLMKVATYFECATESNNFLDILDGAGDLESAWLEYCDQRGIDFESYENDNNPFIDEEYE